MNSLSILAAVYLSTAAPACTTVESVSKLPPAEYPSGRKLCEEVEIEIKDSVAAGYLSATDGKDIIDRCYSTWAE